MKIKDQQRYEIVNPFSLKALCKRLTQIPDNSNNDDFHLVARSNNLKFIHESLFEQNKWVAVQGIGGIGKTTLVQQFIKSLKDDIQLYENSAFILINSADTTSIQSVFVDHIASCLQLKRTSDDMTNEDFIKIIKNQLIQKNINFFFIFDNLQSFDDIKVLINDLDSQKFKILITTRPAHNFGRKFNRLELEMFNNDQAKEYLSENLDREFSNAALREKIFNEFLELFFRNENNKNKILPLMLRLVVGLLNDDKLTRLNDQQKNENIKNELYPQLAVYLLIDDIDDNSLEFKILTFLSLLDGSLIELEFLNDLLDEDKEEVMRLLKKYEKKCLIGMLNKDNQINLQMHDLVQELILEKIQKSEQHLSIKQRLIDNIQLRLSTINEKNDRNELANEKSKIIHYKKLSNQVNKEIKQFAMLNEIANLIENAFHDFRGKEKILKKAEEITSDEQEKSVVLNNLGMTYQSLGEYNKALEYKQKSLKIDEKIYETNHPDIAGSYNNIGMTYDSLGEYNKALEYYEKSLKIFEKIYEADHPNIATSYNNIGMTYDSLGEYNKALEYYEKSLKIREKIYEADHPDIASSYNNIGATYESLGEYNKALEYYEKSLQIFQKIFRNDHPYVISVKNNLIRVQKINESNSVKTTYNLNSDKKQSACCNIL